LISGWRRGMVAGRGEGSDMADKQALNATFFAFRKRERGGVLLGATLAYAVIAILIGGGFIALNFQPMMDYFQWTMSLSERAAGADTNNPFGGMTPPASVMALGPMYMLFLIFAYLLLAAYESACLKWMIRGETSGVFGLALDGDTFRTYLTYWVWFFLIMALYLLCFIIVFVLAAGAIMGAQSGAEPSPATFGIIVLCAFGFLAVMIIFGVRFAPAAATSVATRRFAFFDAWTVTKGRFWSLLGSFALLFLMYCVGLSVLGGVAAGVMGATLLTQLQAQGEAASPQEVFALFASPAVWGPLVFIYGAMIAGAFVFYVALFGVNARAAALAVEEGKISVAS